jgi:hypothetical protein
MDGLYYFVLWTLLLRKRFLNPFYFSPERCPSTSLHSFVRPSVSVKQLKNGINFNTGGFKNILRLILIVFEMRQYRTLHLNIFTLFRMLAGFKLACNLKRVN